MNEKPKAVFYRFKEAYFDVLSGKLYSTEANPDYSSIAKTSDNTDVQWKRVKTVPENLIEQKVPYALHVKSWTWYCNTTFAGAVGSDIRVYTFPPVKIHKAYQQQAYLNHMFNQMN